MRLDTVEIPLGDAGTAATLAMMRSLVHQGLRSPAILQWAKVVVDGAVEPDDQIRAIEWWMRDHFVFRNDPQVVNGIRVYDLLAHPLALLEMYREHSRVVGDCDDAAVLVAVLAKANLLPVRFRVVSFTGKKGPFSHVYPLLKGQGGWFSLDVTRPLDTQTPRVTRVAEVTV